MARADTISIVEAAYDLRSDDRTWLQNLVDVFQDVHQFPLGMLSYNENDEAWFVGWSCMGGICSGVQSQPVACADGCNVCQFGCSNKVCNY